MQNDTNLARWLDFYAVCSEMIPGLIGAYTNVLSNFYHSRDTKSNVLFFGNC